jgi:hypothetical protein
LKAAFWTDTTVLVNDKTPEWKSPDIHDELLRQAFGLEEAVMTTQQIDLAVFPEMEEADTELVPCDDLRSEIISVDPERMWGTPCFVGTRLPVKSLFDHLASGVSLEEFFGPV